MYSVGSGHLFRLTSPGNFTLYCLYSCSAGDLLLWACRFRAWDLHWKHFLLNASGIRKSLIGLFFTSFVLSSHFVAFTAFKLGLVGKHMILILIHLFLIWKKKYIVSNMIIISISIFEIVLIVSINSFVVIQYYYTSPALIHPVQCECTTLGKSMLGNPAWHMLDLLGRDFYNKIISVHKHFFP